MEGRTAKHEITAPKEEGLCSACRTQLSPTSVEAGGQQSHPAAPIQLGGTGNKGSTGKMQSLVPLELGAAASCSVCGMSTS